MLTVIRQFSCLVLGACVLWLAGCGGGGDGGAAGTPGGPADPGSPGGGGTGTLAVSVSGLPTGTPANVSVTGPGGFTRALTASATLTGLAAGTYTVASDNVLNGTSLYSAAQPSQTASVGAGASPSVTVAYGAPQTFRLALTTVASGLTSPIFLTAPANDPRLFVVERAGRIRILPNGTAPATPLATPFLDISALTTTDGERGLLSMAFDPDYATNGRFYVYYTAADGAITVARYQVSTGNANVANGTGTVLLSIPHPGQSNHNGGQLAFGPDGMLYLATGDGGGSNDPANNAQNTASLLGKVIRIDVRGTGYAVPPGNPFANGAGGRAEIWARGLRNPWRFSFDTDGLLYIADVGEGAREEVNVQPATAGGLNYGWDRIEGTACVGAATCDTTGLTPPAFEYSHADGGCAILGGYVYRGSAVPELRGRYFYTDLCTGRLQSFAYRDGVVTESVDWSLPLPGTVFSFGADAARELYVLSNGQVLRVARGS
ncbi:PQQ-dependent sugar dehydrogenase [Cupriavidus pauculus]|uniref:PQQ-dependent sugar dehydrogenase n=1 Tax=Cupriavidus pauculus TaxID=82633 RepID=A0A5P2HBA8_9BURK|nr:PQQ-dependent sugar dehydrogenase [Cupriavidus pauculus]QET04884.1 PQQ-dependent sugar dehydrogenase [Cupriavidus pauculus]